MTGESWRGSIVVRCGSPERADRLFRALLPEAAREVPRAHATLERDAPAAVRIAVEAKDTGALRAALNTYLGWVHLADRTEAVADSRAGEPSPPSAAPPSSRSR